MTTRTVLITGAGSGIGRALAREAAAAGHRLILVGRRLAPLEETRALLPGTEAACVPADITTAEGRAAVASAVAAAGGLDVLVNNAGQVLSGSLAETDDAALAALLATNVLAPMALCRLLLPALAARRGQVVNIGSVFGDIAFPYFAAYSASKFALRGYSDALRRELAPMGIAVSYLAPRGTKTDAVDGFAALVGPMGMVLDPPELVARRAWATIAARKAHDYPRSRERFFVLVQRLRPGLIDRALMKLARDPAVRAAAARR